MNRKKMDDFGRLYARSAQPCGVRKKADGGDASGAAALESALRQVRDKLDEARMTRPKAAAPQTIRNRSRKNAGTGGGCGAGAVSS